MILKIYNGLEIQVDEEDISRMLIFSSSWYKVGDGYIGGRGLVNGKRKQVRLARFIINALDSPLFVDHINHDILDHRKENLRLVTARQSNINRRHFYKDQGVNWHEPTKKWRVNISIEGRGQVHVGLFKDKEDALKARREAELKYYKEFNPINI